MHMLDEQIACIMMDYPLFVSIGVCVWYKRFEENVARQVITRWAVFLFEFVCVICPTKIYGGSAYQLVGQMCGFI